MSKIKDALMLLCFVLLVTIILGYTYLSQIDGIYVNQPVKFHYWEEGGLITHQTTKLAYYPGETVYAKIITYKGKIWPAMIQWNLTNGCFHPYPAKHGTLEPGRTEKIIAIEKLEPDAKPGEDYFYGSATFDLNFVRRKIHVPLRTNTFMVLEPEKK